MGEKNLLEKKKLACKVQTVLVSPSLWPNDSLLTEDKGRGGSRTDSCQTGKLLNELKVGGQVGSLVCNFRCSA